MKTEDNDNLLFIQNMDERISRKVRKYLSRFIKMGDDGPKL